MFNNTARNNKMSGKSEIGGSNPADGGLKATYGKYRSPLSDRYASPEMSYNYSELKKFSTWRLLWTYLAKAEKVSLY